MTYAGLTLAKASTAEYLASKALGGFMWFWVFVMLYHNWEHKIVSAGCGPGCRVEVCAREVCGGHHSRRGVSGIAIFISQLTAALLITIQTTPNYARTRSTACPTSLRRRASTTTTTATATGTTEEKTS